MARLVVDGTGLIPDAATPDDVYGCDGLVVGLPTKMGVLSWKMKRFWDEPCSSTGGRWTERWPLG